MSDVQAVVWKEWRELLRISGNRKSALATHIFSVAVIGVIWPWQFGVPFVRSGLGAVLAVLTAFMYVAGASPDTFAGERERHTLETLLASRLPDRAILLGKLTAMIEYGCAATVVMLIIGLITVNVVHGDGRLLLFDGGQTLAILVFTPLSAGLMASIGVHVSLRAKTVKQAQQTLSTAIIVLLFLPALAIPTLPDSWEATTLQLLRGANMYYVGGALAAGMLALQSLLVGIAAMRFKRARLIV
jgi:ABC-2 type transport system permease protein